MSQNCERSGVESAAHAQPEDQPSAEVPPLIGTQTKDGQAQGEQQGAGNQDGTTVVAGHQGADAWRAETSDN
ncbi:hypothetical protein GCM10010977_29430 [Citricoccus zhacaiensis]|uniref:Uncharacterized protein n=1 Tax=Citricoccus zhacaiensis TaxID=489142 RepID=A0ABQ2MD84_9MICC|nr:hypothetical protein GCM10010977_29430 [Citricoccus zhacaiensis]